MEGVERKLKTLQLSKAERKGVKLSKRSTGSSLNAKAQAVGKLMSNRPARVDSLVSTLGWIWCPFRGIECKDLGMNIFLFTFREEGGKMKALTSGPDV